MRVQLVSEIMERSYGQAETSTDRRRVYMQPIGDVESECNATEYGRE